MFLFNTMLSSLLFYAGNEIYIKKIYASKLKKQEVINSAINFFINIEYVFLRQ